jgi:hypothetical protein
LKYAPQLTSSMTPWPTLWTQRGNRALMSPRSSGGND